MSSATKNLAALAATLSWQWVIPSRKRLQNYGKSQFFMGKSTISMAMASIATWNYQRVNHRTGIRALKLVARDSPNPFTVIPGTSHWGHSIHESNSHDDPLVSITQLVGYKFPKKLSPWISTSKKSYSCGKANNKTSPKSAFLWVGFQQSPHGRFMAFGVPH